MPVMLFDLSSAATAAGRALRANGIRVSHTHLLHVAAALLGYGTYDAFLRDSKEACDRLDEAEYVVLDRDYAAVRAHNLAIVPADAAISALQNELVAQVVAPEAKVFRDTSSFYDELYDMISTLVFNSDEASSAMAMTNAYFDDSYVDELIEDEPIREASVSWSLRAIGALSGEQDDEKTYHGDTINFDVRMEFNKAGRVGLTKYVEAEISAAVDRDDLDED